MYILLLLLFIIAAVIVVIFFEPIAISFFLDTNRMDMHAVMRWIPFIRIEARVIDYRLFITAYFFQKKIYSKFMKARRKGKSRTAFFESMVLTNTSAKISYGLSEPFMTGIFCGAVDFVASLIRTADIELEPEFIPENEYLRIKAKTNLNAGKTLINILRTKLENSRKKKIYKSAETN